MGIKQVSEKIIQSAEDAISQLIAGNEKQIEIMGGFKVMKKQDCDQPLHSFLFEGEEYSIVR